jgi:PAS domain-containing protein
MSHPLNDQSERARLESTRAALNCFAIPLLQLDREGRTLVHNTAWEALMEATPTGTALDRYVHPEDRELWLSMLRVDARPPSSTRRIRFVHPQGDLRWLDISFGVSQHGFSMSAWDATAMHRHQSALEVATHSATSLIENLPALVYRGRNDRDWTMEVMSKGCLELTGYPADQLRNGRHVKYSSLISPQDSLYVWDTVQSALREHRPYELCYTIRCADGQAKRIVEKGLGVYAENGEVLGIEGVMLELDAHLIRRLSKID